MGKGKAISQQRVADTQARVRVTAAAGREGLCPLEDAHAIPMWTYYQAHRDRLINDVRLYREAILTALREGKAVEDAFRPYFRDTSVFQAELRKPKANASAARPAWPWKALTTRASAGAYTSHAQPGRAVLACAQSSTAKATRGTSHASSRRGVCQPPGSVHLAVVGRTQS